MACKYRGPGLATCLLNVVADLVGAALFHQVLISAVSGVPCIDTLAHNPISYLVLTYFHLKVNFGAKILRP